MKARFVKVGNSQALMIPIEIMREHGWKAGDSVELERLAGGLAILEARKRKPIAELARRFVSENRDLIEKLSKL